MEKDNEFKIKKYVFYILLAFLAVFITAKNVSAQSYQAYVYRDLGTYKVNYPDGSSIGIHAYVVKSPNNSGYYAEYGNQFSLVAESTSVYRNYYTETWLYGVRVFMNNVQVTYNQYPNGIASAYIKTTPTVIYNWYTNDNDVGNYYFSWNSSAYVIK